MTDERENRNKPTEMDLSQTLPSMAELIDTFPLMDTIMRRTKDMMWSVVQLKELQMMYTCALKEVRTKFEVLDTEFATRFKRNPIKTITTRLKSTDSIIEKLIRYGFPMTLGSIEENLNDVAGIRVVCSYIDDIYRIADSLLKQDDITLLRRKDYIANPKPNGYRSLHLIVKVPVFFADKSKEMKVEVQIRTIAMDFWASLEHQISYKHETPPQKRIALGEELKTCADVITQTDQKMLELRKQIEEAEDIPSEEEVLLEKLRRLNVPMG